MTPAEQNYGYFYSVYAIENYANSRGVSLAQWAGEDLAQLFKRAQISRLISNRATLSFIEAAIKHFDDELLGMAVGQRYQHSTYGILGLAIMSAANIGESLQIAINFSELGGSLVELSIEQEADALHITLVRNRSLAAEIHQFLILEIITGLITFWRKSCAETIEIDAGFDFDLSPSAKTFCQHQLGKNIRWNEPSSHVRLSDKLLATPFVTTNPFALAEAVHACDQLKNNLVRSTSLLATVRQQIMANITQRPSAKVIADKLGISERSLHRKLSNEGMSFKSLISDLLVEHLHLWETDGLSQASIAKRLGFADVSNYLRAKGRWLSD